MIRKGEKKDALQIAKLKIENYRKTYKNIFSEEYLANMNIESEAKKYIDGLEKREVLVYCQDEKILGYIYYGNRTNNPEILTEYSGEINAIYVDINYRNMGIGTKLIKVALKNLMNKYERIILWCASENIESINFYEKRNFKKKSKINNMLGNKEVKEIAMVYDFTDISNYKTTRFVAYEEKNNIIVVYSNFNLIFLKDETAKWFKDILNKNEGEKLPIKFLRYLKNKEVIEIA